MNHKPCDQIQRYVNVQVLKYAKPQLIHEMHGKATPASKPPLKKRIGAWALDWLQRHGYVDE